jgi:hypothetical protein
MHKINIYGGKALRLLGGPLSFLFNSSRGTISRGQTAKRVTPTTDFHLAPSKMTRAAISSASPHFLMAWRLIKYMDKRMLL